MRLSSTLIAVGVLALAAIAVRAAGAHAPPGVPSWALMSFAVAAFHGPVR